MSTPLLPCPMCNSSDVLVRHVAAGAFVTSVSCKRCCLELARSTEAEAVLAWNTRHAPSPASCSKFRDDGYGRCESCGNWPSAHDASLPAARGVVSEEMVRIAQEAFRASVDEQCARPPRGAFNSDVAMRAALSAALSQGGGGEEWTSVKERMPEDDEVVMVYLANGHYCEDWVDKDTGDFLNYECLWADGKIPMQALEYGSYATHWRPLPKPPAQADGV